MNIDRAVPARRGACFALAGNCYTRLCYWCQGFELLVAQGEEETQAVVIVPRIPGHPACRLLLYVDCTVQVMYVHRLSMYERVRVGNKYRDFVHCPAPTSTGD